MPNFNLEEYEPVEERIKKFYNDHPNGRIITELVSDDGNRVVFKAYLFKELTDQIFWSTGYAEERMDDGKMVNKTSRVENCETSAIGRALANANYSGDKRPSREEMMKVQRMETKKVVIDEQPHFDPKHLPVDKEGNTYCEGLNGKPCGAFVSAKSANFSRDTWGKTLCYNHQNEIRKLKPGVSGK